ncbi:cyclic nucleotide-binding domain-containing protein [Variovorax sp. PCZ-1]|uniref:Crp/Fnr family transcriptional regulator n=1 Tax=Variovorax sp. PCZ-1 TaxID=2835533 RepID=UPI001BCC8A29|nr:cyclic nucleotide-binding domain-containing protein [Variovorax sp. PCZ-1]MBS7807333.1 cyclic nucleotide-binding domain-containing protein [Variovorax sp. PCZ-1]
MPDNKLKDLPPSIARLAESGVIRSYKKKSIIISEGDSGDTLLVLLEGSVRVFGQDGNGKEVTYGHIDAPSYFGEMSLDGGPRSASIEATTACKCAVITRERVRASLATSPELATELITKIIARARAATDTVRSLALKDAYGRLREVLEHLAIEPDENGHRKIKSGTTHASLALQIGTSREMVSKILRDLETGGYVRTEGRNMTLVKALPRHW